MKTWCDSIRVQKHGTVSNEVATHLLSWDKAETRHGKHAFIYCWSCTKTTTVGTFADHRSVHDKNKKVSSKVATHLLSWDKLRQPSAQDPGSVSVQVDHEVASVTLDEAAVLNAQGTASWFLFCPVPTDNLCTYANLHQCCEPRAWFFGHFKRTNRSLTKNKMYPP
jgi:hypothetical protein